MGEIEDILDVLLFAGAEYPGLTPFRHDVLDLFPGDERPLPLPLYPQKPENGLARYGEKATATAPSRASTIDRCCHRQGHPVGIMQGKGLGDQFPQNKRQVGDNDDHNRQGEGGGGIPDDFEGGFPQYRLQKADRGSAPDRRCHGADQRHPYLDRSKKTVRVRLSTIFAFWLPSAMSWAILLFLAEMIASSAPAKKPLARMSSRINEISSRLTTISPPLHKIFNTCPLCIFPVKAGFVNH